MKRFTVQIGPGPFGSLHGQVDVEENNVERAAEVIRRELNPKLDGRIEAVVLNREKVWLVSYPSGETAISQCIGSESARRFEMAKDHRLMMAAGNDPVTMKWDR